MNVSKCQSGLYIVVLYLKSISNECTKEHALIDEKNNLKKKTPRKTNGVCEMFKALRNYKVGIIMYLICSARNRSVSL